LTLWAQKTIFDSLKLDFGQRTNDLSQFIREGSEEKNQFFGNFSKSHRFFYKKGWLFFETELKPKSINALSVNLLSAA